MLKKYQSNLWDNLTRLCDEREAFYYVDQERNSQWHRIFVYRLLSYTDFMFPDALNCRGTTFSITEEGKNAKPIDLISLPLEKFFNAYENPLVMDLSLSNINEVSLKVDGSLISTYLLDEQVACKTKGSLWSTQAIAAENFLYQSNNKNFLEELKVLEYSMQTIIMEWCAPDNRVVIGYNEPHLTVLGIRSRYTGEYVFNRDDIKSIYPEIYKRWVMLYDPLQDFNSYEDFVQTIPQMTGIEGYVLTLQSGQRVKLKTEWYLTQHKAKESINSDKRLFEAVLAETTDDLRTLFRDDPASIQRIENMEKRTSNIYNHIVSGVDAFYEQNKHLERKEYAILGQHELDRNIFGLAMSRYLGKPADYKQWMMKHYKDYGISDQEKKDE